jgi:hypothetical protein
MLVYFLKVQKTHDLQRLIGPQLWTNRRRSSIQGTRRRPAGDDHAYCGDAEENSATEKPGDP